MAAFWAEGAVLENAHGREKCFMFEKLKDTVRPVV